MARLHVLRDGDEIIVEPRTLRIVAVPVVSSTLRSDPPKPCA
jgi:hypothetical protein